MISLSFQSFATALLALSPIVAGNCNNFTATRDYYTLPASTQTQSISRGYKCDAPNSDYFYPLQMRCNSSNECPTFATGVVNGLGTNNLSLTKDQVLPLYNLIYASISGYKPITFLYSLSDTLGNTSSCLAVNGTSNSTGPSEGHWAFTPDLVCVDGILSQCTNGPVNDNTAIQVCAVRTYGDAVNTYIEGTVAFVVTDYESDASLASNPAANRSAVAREPASTSTSTPSSGAKQVIPGSLLVGLTIGIWTIL